MAGEQGDLSFRVIADLATLKQQMTQITSMLDGIAKTTAGSLGKAATTTIGWNKAIKQTSDNLWNVRTSLKDIGNVANGILMARAINEVLRGLMRAVTALKEFNSLLETTRISFKYMLGDVTKATDMINAVEELAARTPFTFQTGAQSAQRLLALGFNDQQIIPMMRVMADLASVTGGDAVESMTALSYAFGKVQAMGKMTTRELRLFVSANIPIYKILREELGLTDKDFQKLRISASDALPAILRGIAKYKGAAAEAEQTIPGLLSSIHDYALFLGQDLLQGFWESVRGILQGVRDALMRIREAFKLNGLKGLLLEILPPEFALSIYQAIVAIKDMVRAMSNMWQVSGTLFQEIARLALIIFNGLVKAMAVATRILEALTTSAGRCIPMVRILAAVIIGLITAYSASKAIMMLIGTFVQLFSTAGSVVGILVVVLGLLTALALAIPGVSNWFTNIGNKIAKIFGLQIPQSIAVTKAALSGGGNQYLDYEQSLQDLINGFSDTGEAADDAAGAAEKASKKIKDTFLASFDEVYQIQEETADASSGLGGSLGALGEIPTLDMGDLGGIGDAIAGAESSLYKFNFTLAEFKELMKEVFEHGWNQIKLFFGAVGDSLMEIGPKILPTLFSLIGPIINTITLLITTIISTLAILTPRVISSLIFLLSGIIINIIDIITTIITVLAQNFPAILKYVDALLALLGVNIAGLLAQIAIIAANGIIDMIMYMGSSWQAGMGFVKLWFNLLNNLFWMGLNEVFHLANTIVGLGFQLLWDTFKKSFGVLGTSISDQFKLTLKLLSGKITFSEFKQQLVSNFNDNLISAAAEIQTSYSDKLTDAVTNSGNRIEMLTKNQMMLMADSAAKLSTQMIKDLGDMTKVDEAMKKAQDAVTAWTNKWSAETLPLVIEAGKELGEGLSVSITDALKGMDLEGKSVETINGLLDIWGGVGSELSPIITSFLSDTGTTWSTWWDSAGKPLWKGTGEDLNTIWTNWMAMSKEDFKQFWDDVHQIHVEYGELLNNDANKSWSEFAEANKKFGQRYVGDAQDSWSEYAAAYKKYGAEPVALEMSKLPSVGEGYLMALGMKFDTETGKMIKTVDTAMLDIKTNITNTLLEAQPIVETNTKAISDIIVAQIQLSEIPIKDSISKIPTYISDQTEEVTSRSQSLAESVIEQMQRVFNDNHPTIVTDIDIPKVELPNGKSWGDFTVRGDNVALAANGGVFTREQFIGISEGNKPEGVFPLNAQTMAPFAQMIANFMGQQGTSVERNSAASDYVMVPINKKDLNRELYILQQHEVLRRGV